MTADCGCLWGYSAMCVCVFVFEDAPTCAKYKKSRIGTTKTKCALTALHYEVMTVKYVLSKISQEKIFKSKTC